jgi:hypothetical protein
MQDIDGSLPALGLLMEQRLELLRSLAASLESSSLALGRNDAEAIARGAAHQAELCRQWSCLESELRRKGKEPGERRSGGGDEPGAAVEGMRLQAEWEALAKRIRYLTRVHWSLLRHLERSLVVLQRVVDSCAPTYAPQSAILTRVPGLEVGVRVGATTGE